MKIIKEGKAQPSRDTPVRFTCKHCGCEFLAEKGEYDAYVNFKDLRTTDIRHLILRPLRRSSPGESNSYL